MTTDDNIVQFEPRADGGESDTRGRFRALACERLTALFRHMLDQVDDALFERAETAGNNREQNLYFDAMRHLRRARPEIERRFGKRLEQIHAQAPHGRPRRTQDSGATPLDDPDTLSLVDDEALEERLAIDNMVSKARTRSAQSLAHLCQRLDADTTREWANEDTNPVDPRQICSALEYATEGLELDIRIRLTLYKLFDRYVVSQLGGLYHELNQLYIDAGILPTIKAQAPRTGTTPRPPEHPPEPAGKTAPGPSAGPAGGSGGPAESNPGGGDATFSLFQSLLAASRQAPTWSGTGYTGSGEAAPLQDVVGALSGLQVRFDSGGPAADATPETSPRAVGARVREQLGATAGGVGQVADDTIDIVSLLFDAILDDPNLPDGIKALLARLQIPVLKVALLDRAFFDRRDHPARLLINEMAHAAVGWNEDDRAGGDPLDETIEAIVGRTLQDFQTDVSTFEEALAEFRAIQEEQRRRAEAIERRTREAAEHKARVEFARQRVDDCIRERVGHWRLPECVDRLLYDHWSQVLFRTLLQRGEASADWQHQLGVVERLLWSLEAKPDAAGRKELLAAIPRLLQDLRRELEPLLPEPARLQALFKELEREHIHTLSRPREAAAQREPERAPRTDLPEDTSRELELDESGDDEGDLPPHRERVDGIAVGTWFEFSQAEGEPLRGKLFTRLHHGDRLIFVDRAGVQVADYRRDALAAALRDETAVILDDNMLFDRALESVVESLRAMRDR